MGSCIANGISHYFRLQVIESTPREVEGEVFDTNPNDELVENVESIQKI